MAQHMIEISDEDELVLKSDIGGEITDWILNMVQQKIRHQRQQLVKEFKPKMIEDGSLTAVPVNEDELIPAILAHPDFETADQKRERHEAQREEQRKAKEKEQEEYEKEQKANQERIAAALKQQREAEIKEAVNAAIAEERAKNG